MTTAVVGSGTVGVNTSNPHNCGTDVLLTATPNSSCWAFSAWSGDLTGSTNPATITMNSNKSVTATFTQITYDLTLTATNGSITAPAGGNPHTYNCSQNVSIVAAPANASCTFVNWSGNWETIGNVTSNSTYIIMNSSKTIVANFNVSVGPCTPGTISDLSIVPETQNGIQYNAIRLTWSAPNYGGNAVDSYEVRYSTSGAITDGNWASATNATSVDYADGGTPRASGVTETCTVNSLTENTSYYFAIQSTKSGQTSNASNSPTAKAQQSRLDVGDWWLYKVYYIDNTGTAGNNTVYQINDVSAVNQTTTVNWTTGGPANMRTVTNSAVIEWNLAQNGSPAHIRYRDAYTGNALVTHGYNMEFDQTQYVGAYDPSTPAREDPYVWIDPNPGFSAWSNSYTNQSYFYGTNWNQTAMNANYDAAKIGYPFPVGSNVITKHEYNYVYTGASISTVCNWLYNDNVSVSSFNSSYNISSPVTCPNITGYSHDGGAGVYGVYNVSTVMLNGTANSYGPGPYWVQYSPQAHGFVRKYDGIAYYGHEDWLLQTYETADFGKSNLSVGNTSGNVSVSITITNNKSDVAQRFNVVCMVMDMQPPMKNGGGITTYTNGVAVYPNVSTPGPTWPFFPAIQQTSLLNPGASQTLTWSGTTSVTAINGTSGHQWRVWCSGMTYNFSNP